MGVLTNKEKAEGYRRLAYQCASNEVNNACDNICDNCPLNISLFLEDQKEAVLIKMSAMQDYQQDLANEQVRNKILKEARDKIAAREMGNIIALLIFFGLIFWIFSSIRSCFSG